MITHKYPIGVQSFPKLIEGGFAYVDKTGFIGKLVAQRQYVFLSRPRRFGKSLLLSTLHAYFDGRRDLFRGLALDRMDVDWTRSPVLHFDLNSENFRESNGLEKLLSRLLDEYEEEYNIIDKTDTLAGRFSRLIKGAYKVTGRKVVILVDEYDKPLLGIEDDLETFEKNQAILKGFFGNLKSMDQYIRFAFLTGVARFNKVSIFSDVNHLDDISLSNEFADICGWTEEELLKVFRPGIEALSKERGEDFNTTLSAMRNFYDGYLFAPKGSRLYNPFSVLRSLASKEIEPYWFETGTPTFLAKRIKANGIEPDSINGQICTREDLSSIVVGMRNPIPLMFQTGYLTISKYNKLTELYELKFPNREVEVGFSKFLLPLYAPATDNAGGPFNFTRFKIDLYTGHPEDFMQRLAILLKNLPGSDHCESTYRAITYLLCILCGTQTIAEHVGHKGRSDLEVLTPQYIYLFEFKYNRSVQEAIGQIADRDYAARYALDHRPVWIIGANFCERKDERGLTYKIESLKK